MSNSVSKDEEIKRILALSKSDDSKESPKLQGKKIPTPEIKDDLKYETNDEDTPDSEW